MCVCVSCKKCLHVWVHVCICLYCVYYKLTYFVVQQYDCVYCYTNLKCILYIVLFLYKRCVTWRAKCKTTANCCPLKIKFVDCFPSIMRWVKNLINQLIYLAQKWTNTIMVTEGKEYDKDQLLLTFITLFTDKLKHQKQKYWWANMCFVDHMNKNVFWGNTIEGPVTWQQEQKQLTNNYKSGFKYKYCYTNHFMPNMDIFLIFQFINFHLRIISCKER